MRKSTLKKKIRKFLQLRTEVARLNKELNELKEELIHEAQQHDGVVEVDGHKVTHTVFYYSYFDFETFKKRCKKTCAKFMASRLSSRTIVK